MIFHTYLGSASLGSLFALTISTILPFFIYCPKQYQLSWTLQIRLIQLALIVSLRPQAQRIQKLSMRLSIPAPPQYLPVLLSANCLEEDQNASPHNISVADGIAQKVWPGRLVQQRRYLACKGLGSFKCSRTILLPKFVHRYAYALMTCGVEIIEAPLAEDALRYCWDIDWCKLPHEIYHDVSESELHWSFQRQAWLWVPLLDDFGNLIRVHHVGAVRHLYSWERKLGLRLTRRDADIAN